MKNPNKKFAGTAQFLCFKIAHRQGTFPQPWILEIIRVSQCELLVAHTRIPGALFVRQEGELLNDFSRCRTDRAEKKCRKEKYDRIKFHRLTFPHTGDTIGNRMTPQLIHRVVSHHIPGQIAVLGIALQQPLALQKSANALGNRMRQLGPFLIRWRLDPLKSCVGSVGAVCIDAIEEQHMGVRASAQTTHTMAFHRDTLSADDPVGKVYVIPQSGP